MWQADDLAEELTKLGYEVFVVDDFTVSWDGPADEYHIGSHPSAGDTHMTEKSQQQPNTPRWNTIEDLPSLDVGGSSDEGERTADDLLRLDLN